jgi:hypothetical protein
MSEAQKLEFAVLRAAVISKARGVWRRKQLKKPIPGRWTVVPRGNSAWH